MVSDGTEFAVGDIERLRRLDETQKLNRKNGRNIIIDVGVVCKLRVLDVNNNNVVIWKAGKRLTINVDQVRIYRHWKCDETEIGTGNSRITVVCAMNQVVLTVQRRSNDSRDGKKKGSERGTQQGGPVCSRKGRERNDNPYIEERTRSSNKNARRGGDQQRQDQERRGTWTKKSLSLEVLVENANCKS
ncbi:hypothetical protein TNCV_489411 [Trichonephila clavipes]|nr:hypothetical protein TNCV_489411 [Trichonephila clavipes]